MEGEGRGPAHQDPSPRLQTRTCRGLVASPGSFWNATRAAESFVSPSSAPPARPSRQVSPSELGPVDATIARGLRYFGLAALVDWKGEAARKLWRTRRWAAMLVLLAVLAALWGLSQGVGALLQ